MKQKVAGIISDLLAKRRVDSHKHVLKVLGKRAVPEILEYLKASDLASRKTALFCLQYCFSREAANAVAGLLGDSDSEIRDYAEIVIGRNEGLQGLAERYRAFLDDPLPEIARSALCHVEDQFPDLERTRNSLTRTELAEGLWKNLPRYFSPSLTSGTQALLQHDSADTAWSAVAGLIQQTDRCEDTRRLMTEWLFYKPAETREMAAEYLTWHGEERSLDALKEALDAEKDHYAAAAIRTAVEVIEVRGSCAGLNQIQEEQTLPKTLAQDPLNFYREQLARIDGKKERSLVNGLHALKWAEAYEPRWEFQGSDAKSNFSKTRMTRFQLQQSVFKFKGSVGEAEAFHGDVSCSRVGTMMPPVRDYFDNKRTSFGKHMADDVDAFGGLVHVGDDVHWFKDHRTVVAIAPGIVRLAGYLPTWGFIVVLEHLGGGGGRFCSVYAHLGPSLWVSPGMVVRQGWKLGVIGRGYTFENGGYPAHLHFALHNGPYQQKPHVGSSVEVEFKGRMHRGRVVRSDFEFTDAEIRTGFRKQIVRKSSAWLRGYVSNWSWKVGLQRWCDPQISIAHNWPEE